jgi:hypothetical protein
VLDAPGKKENMSLSDVTLDDNTIEHNLEALVNQTYVFEGTEVTPTGRIAKKPIKLYRNKTAYEYLFEIEPCDKEGPSWKRWVSIKDMYTVVKSSEI